MLLGKLCTRPVLLAIVTFMLLVKSEVSKLVPNSITASCTKLFALVSPSLNNPKLLTSFGSTWSYLVSLFFKGMFVKLCPIFVEYHASPIKSGVLVVSLHSNVSSLLD